MIFAVEEVSLNNPRISLNEITGIFRAIKLHFFFAQIDNKMEPTKVSR
jgi:hypothetical protein